MTLTELEEVVDLELVLALSPLCEDDHQWMTNGREAACPPCGIEAVALLVQTCPPMPTERSRTLICQPLRDWLTQPGGEAQCSRHNSDKHIKIFDL